MKKAIGQTVRDLKREVNKKVLKVPVIEQKVLDATNNEAWGPHGSLLADIAHATKNYHEHQMIMAVIWKRINDTGKNWRHVHKALTVLEYLVANGSDRVIEDIREHAHQISTLSNFQYVDSGGRDQGNNIRKKSQSLILLVNDKERIIEVRQKAAANRDKYHNNSTDGMYRPGSYSSSGTYGERYDDHHYGNREEDGSGSGFGREREWGNRGDDRYGRDGDHFERDYEERYSRDGYRDDEYRGRSQSVDDYQYGSSRSRSSDKEHNRSYGDDGQRSPRDGGISKASAPRGSSPVSDNLHQISAPIGSSLVSENPMEATAAAETATSGNWEVEASDEFDPRGPVSAAPSPANNVEMGVFGSLPESFSSNALALVPSSSATTTPQGNANLDSTTPFAPPSSASNNFSPLFEDPFGDSPFKAIPSTETAPFQPHMHQSLEPSLSGPNTETVSNFGIGDSFSIVPYSTPGARNSQVLPQDLSMPPQELDILADILPPAPLPGTTLWQNFSASPSTQSPPSFSASSEQMASQSFLVQTGQLTQQAFSAPRGQLVQPPFSVPTNQHAQQPFLPQGSTTPIPLDMAPQAPTGQPSQSATAHLASQSPMDQVSRFNSGSGNFIAQQGDAAPFTHQPPGGKQSLLGQGVNAPAASQYDVSQPSKDKFETKSTVWADTLSRGLVNLNISGPKINPLADIGIDFDAINRKEKRMEKPTTATVTSTTMGKAMGSGSGIGRVGAGVGMGVGGYGGINVTGMGMGQGVQMQPPGSNVAGNYNFMRGTGGYPQQPYGGGGYP